MMFSKYAHGASRFALGALLAAVGWGSAFAATNLLTFGDTNSHASSAPAATLGSMVSSFSSSTAVASGVRTLTYNFTLNQSLSDWTFYIENGSGGPTGSLFKTADIVSSPLGNFRTSGTDIALETNTFSAQLNESIAAGAYSLKLTFDSTNGDFQGYLATNTAPVPEPAEWAMLLAGLGFVGLIARKRRDGRTGSHAG